MAGIERKTKRYPSDMTAEEWALIAPLLPGPARTGRPRQVDLREVLNAIRYLVRTGCGWRILPKDLPPWQTVYDWFRCPNFRIQIGSDLAPVYRSTR